MHSCHIFLQGRIPYTTGVFFVQFGVWEDVFVAAWFSPAHLLTWTNLSIQCTPFFFLLCLCFQPLLYDSTGTYTPRTFSSEV